MDEDGDGVVVKREMLAYMSPKHPYRHTREAERLLGLADADADGKLTLDEVLDAAPYIADSKWLAPEKAFHGNT